VLSIAGYILSFLLGSFLAGVVSFLLYLEMDFDLFSGGCPILDTTTPASYYKVVETISSPADIIYDELCNNHNIEKYNIMQLESPHIVIEKQDESMTVKGLRFEAYTLQRT